MRRFGIAVLAMAGLLLLAVGMLVAQQEGGASGTRGEGAYAGQGPLGGRTGSADRDLERLSRTLTEAGLIGTERSAAETAAKAKLEARRELVTALEELRAATEDTKATDEKLGKAMAAYRKALSKYRGQVEAQDRALAAKLSVRSQAKCLAAGILDNGLLMGGGGVRRGARGERPAR